MTISTYSKFFSTVILTCSSALGWAKPNTADEAVKDVTELDMAELLKVQVTSVSKKAQALSDAPAAIFVITNEDLKRSGVTSIPEALRLAPGIDVARINANKWAISARGFNGSAANKLLVLIDGRSVYTPGFSGVYWDAQDTVLDDVERIEVIRGPGASLWGANAVNGVINVITKSAEQTQGGLVGAGGGTRESGFGHLRYGKQLADETYGRVYIKGFERDNFDTPQHTNAKDRWNKQQGGFRLDSRLSNQDEVTLQGDIYRTDMNQAILAPQYTSRWPRSIDDDVYSRGWNIISRLKHTFSTTSEYNLQLYYDHTERDEYTSKQSLDTLDLDFQHSFALNDQHHTLWGLGYRANLDKFNITPIVRLTPASRNTQLFSAFIQDEITLLEDALWFTLGSKFEHNDYSGFEGQPTARLMWAPSPRQRLWTSISRSVKTPSRANQDLNLLQASFPYGTGASSIPLALTLNGNKNFQSEVQLSYEVGYRFTLSQKASLDITAFYNEYDKLLSTAQGDLTPHATYLELPINFNNTGKASTYGFEAATVWQMTDWWRWDTNYSFLHTDIVNAEANPTAISPQHKLSLRAVVNPVHAVNVDFWLRYNSAATALTPVTDLSIPTKRISAYVTLDARVAWKILPKLEISVVGQNLLAAQHLEYIDESSVQTTYTPRAVYGKVALEF